MKPKGFTLVELVIVIIIVGILSIVAVPIYNSYTKKAISSEAKALVGSVRSAQQVYLAQYDKFANVEFTTAQKNKWFGVDVSANKYFRSFSVTASGREGNNQYWNLTTICPDKGVTVYSSGSNYYPDMYGGITVYDKNGDIIEDLK